MSTRKPNLRKWKAGKRLSFVQRNVASQITINDDLRVEILNAQLCECGSEKCSGITARFMPLIWAPNDNGKMEWQALAPMQDCKHGVFTELVHAMWRVGKHLDGCKCTRCTTSKARWEKRDSEWKGIHRETGQFVETKVDHENWVSEVPYSDPTLEVEDSITVEYQSEEDQLDEEEMGEYTENLWEDGTEVYEEEE